jgi:hypothetical protein
MMLSTSTYVESEQNQGESVPKLHGGHVNGSDDGNDDKDAVG